MNLTDNSPIVPIVNEPIASWRAERLYRREHPFLWWLSMITPFSTALFVVLCIFWARGWGAAIQFGLTSISIFLIFGKLIIAGGHLEVASGSMPFYSPEQLVGIALFTDFIVTAIVVFHMGLVFRLPFIGIRLERLVSAARDVLASNSWMKRLTYLGLIVFSALPFTGGISGAIMGRLLGMGKLTSFLCVMLGSLTGCGLVYFFSELMMSFFGNENRLYFVGSVLGVGVGIFFVYHWLRKSRQLTKSNGDRV